MNLYEFNSQDSLVYKVSSRTAKDTQKNLVSKKKIKNKNKNFEIKPHKGGNYTKNLATICYCNVFEWFDC